MKTKTKFISAAVALVLAALTLIAPSCAADNNDLTTYVQNINTVESTEYIGNPDQGFYRPIYVKFNESGVSFNKNIVTDATQLYHLRIDASAFSQKTNGTEDKLFTPEALDGLDGLLAYLQEKDKNAVVRFAYDPSFSGKADVEPAPEVIFKHVEQICPVLNAYETVITAVEAGLIGPWGEMHTSKIANSQTINPILEKFLSGTKSIPVLARTPKMIYNYLGITLDDIDGYEIDESNAAYRLGIYNDGYLGSETDLGTYTDRVREIGFLSRQTDHLPFGGEVVIPNSPLHDIETCLPEMAQIHLSYLNVEWNNEVVNKWKNTTYTADCGDDAGYYGQSAFTYISNRMGYRLVLTQSVFGYSDRFDELEVKLKIKNVGFGNLNKKKQAMLIFVDETGEVKCTERAGEFGGGTEARYSVGLDLENGKYEVYLRLYGGEVDGTEKYCLQFANCGIWNEGLSANKIGEITVLK